MITGIAIREQENNVRFYPNPAKEKLTISNLDENYSYQFLLYNSIGKCVQKTIKSGKTKQEIPTDSFSKGLYFLKVESLKGSNIFKIQIE